MRIAIDAMGGDYGPRVTIQGALDAAREYNLEVLLVGVEDVLKKEFQGLGRPDARVTIVDAPESIGMGEGLLSFRRKKKSSIRVSAQLVKEGQAEALVSIGNTGAVVYLSRKVLGRLQGIDKPALALLLPTHDGVSLIIDVGANANCKPHHLEQFAVMGGIFMENILGRTNPRIGLMSIGEEETKGNDLTKAAFDMLKASPLNFIGNIEGKDLYSGKAEVIVCDGFTGNVALKASEGVVESLLVMARHEVTHSLLAKFGFFLIKHNLKKIMKKMDYSQYGGACLLGLNGICIIGHGRSSPLAVKNAIRTAKEYVQNRTQDKIRSEIARLSGAAQGGKA